MQHLPETRFLVYGTAIDFYFFKLAFVPDRILKIFLKKNFGLFFRVLRRNFL